MALSLSRPRAGARLRAKADSPWSKALVRLGFVARGLTYGVIGGLALALALGAGGGATTNQQGALALIDRAPLGQAALVVTAVGLLAYALWKTWQAVLGFGPEGGGGRTVGDRVANLAGAVVYYAFFAVAVSVLIGGGGQSSQSSQPSSTAAGVLGWPAGPELVGLAGAVFMIVCLIQAYQGATGKFMADIKEREMDAQAEHVVQVLGRVGLVARSVVFGLVGYFLIRTAIDYNPSKAVGLDGALRAVYRLPFGSVLLGLAAAGLLVFALFSLAEARYRQL